ncbi:MAG: hypothetical protein EBS21_08915, partial [Sphingomonadaceae bacterium]|nr:hypothetical protein [Sphingomonadaceae bacterium]
SNTTSTINPAAITVSTSNVTKTYDATTTALGTPVAISGSLFTNVSNGGIADSLSGGTYAFIGVNVSRQGGVSSGAVLNDKVVTVASVTVNDGNNGLNYTVTYASNTTSTINPYTVNLTGSRVYDGSSAVEAGIFTLSQLVGQESLSLTGTGSVSNSHVTLVGQQPQAQLLGALGSLDLVDGVGANAGLAINYKLVGGSHNVTITPRPLNFSASVPDKIYDGNTAIQVSSLVIQNQVQGEQLDLIYNPFANFSDKNAGQNKVVTITSIRVQSSPTALSTDYVPLPTTYQASATIFKKDITVVGVVATDKVYDGTTSDIINTSVAALAGQITTDQVSISNMTGTFASKNVGQNIAVVGSAVTLGGVDAGNYNLIQPTGLSANITPRTLVAAATGISRAYDGTTDALVNLTDNRIAGDIISYNYTASFLDKNIGTNKYVRISISSLGGADGGNYVLSANPSTFADVTRAVLSFTPIVSTKSYDGTNSATVSLATNIAAGDPISVSFTDARFDTANAGTGKTVTVTGISVSGDLSNYQFLPTAVTATGSGTITPFLVNLTGSRAYDGFTDVSASALRIGALVGGQTLTLSGTGSIANRNVGNAKLVNSSGLVLSNGTGANAGLAANYTLVGGNQTVDITPANLLITASNAVKTYDGTTSVAGAVQAPQAIVQTGSGTQLFGGDNLIGGSFVYDNANVSRDAANNVLNNHIVTVSAVTVNDGNNGANYAVSYRDNRTSTINPYAVTVTALSQTKTYDATTAAGTSAFTFGSMIGSDAIVSVTLAYSDKNAGQGNKMITPSAAIGAPGTIIGNYAIGYVADTRSSITPAALAGVSGIVVSDKIYDGTTAATVASATFDGIYAGDNVSVAISAGSFDSKDVGLRNVAISSLTLGGSDAQNYLLLSSSGTATGRILPKPLTISALAQTKVYDGTISVASRALGTGYSAAGLVSGESLSDVALDYTNANVSRSSSGAVLSDRTIAASAAVAGAGTSLANYAITYVSNSASTITPAPLKVTVLDLSKVYDGTTAAMGTPAVVADGTTRLFNSATLSGGTANFVSADVGSGKTVQISGVAINDGNGGGNYSIAYVPSTNSTITPRVVSLSATKVFDGTTLLQGAVTINTGIAGQVLGYTDARSVSPGVTMIDNFITKDNFISNIVLIDSQSAKATNYKLPELNATTAPVQIFLPATSMMTSPATYDKLAVSSSQPATIAATDPAVIMTSSSSGTAADTTSSGTNGVTSSGSAVSSAAPSEGFVSVDPLGAPSLENGRDFAVEIPVTAFHHTNANAQITLKAELADGSGLPAWMSFDPVHNILSGSAPAGVSAVSVVVIATDQRGAEIKASINLQFSK